MLSRLNFAALGFLFLMLVVPYAVFDQAVFGTVDLSAGRLTTVDSLAGAEKEGLRFYINDVFEGAEIARVFVCASRSDLPDGVSSSVLVTLRESHEKRFEGQLVSVSQQMTPDNADSLYDVGGFQVRADVLEYLSLFFSHSHRNTGLLSEANARFIEVQFQNIASELYSDNFTFSDYLEEPFCSRPSGRYVGHK